MACQILSNVSRKLETKTKLWVRGWLMVVILLMFKIKLIRIPSAGVGGLCISIFSSFARLALCQGFVCLANVLKIAWGRVSKVMDV